MFIKKSIGTFYFSPKNHSLNANMEKTLQFSFGYDKMVQYKVICDKEEAL